MEKLTVRLSSEQLKQLDAARGTESRSDFIRTAIGYERLLMLGYTPKEIRRNAVRQYIEKENEIILGGMNG